MSNARIQVDDLAGWFANNVGTGHVKLTNYRPARSLVTLADDVLPVAPLTGDAEPHSRFGSHSSPTCGSAS
ncbi:hypothetical protein [Ferrimicrobium acidiphilum]|uniref:hypothetical protein n=1 Tax=Ferrimicrobium acidiphilum TaxID=121039 RepID=UPI0023F024CF|nr:hypothetical protein [Ferrimicrobium acidiphilum]